MTQKAFVHAAMRKAGIFIPSTIVDMSRPSADEFKLFGFVVETMNGEECIGSPTMEEFFCAVRDNAAKLRDIPKKNLYYLIWFMSGQTRFADELWAKLTILNDFWQSHRKQYGGSEWRNLLWEIRL